MAKQKARTLPVIDCTANGETNRLYPTFGDAIAYDLKVGRQFPPASESLAVWTSFLAWRCAKREGIFTGQFQEFREISDLDIDIVEETAPANPTPGAAAPASLSNSR